jgi:hypothetical protein
MTAQSGITADDVIAELQRVAKQIGRPPTVGQYREYAEYSTSPVYRHFQSWEQSLLFAGLEPSERRDSEKTGTERKHSNEELLEDLRRLNAKADGRVSRSDIEEDGKYSIGTYYDRFDGLGGALRQAGILGENEKITVGRCMHGEDVGELIDEMLRVAALVDRPPFQRDMDEFGEFGQSRYKSAFGSWAEALRTSGLPPRYRGGTQRPPERTNAVYGGNWQEQRQKALSRDRFSCQHCGMDNQEHVSQHGNGLNVHHIVPIRQFDPAEYGNHLKNLITLCSDCHSTWEMSSAADVDVDQLVQEIRLEWDSGDSL